MGESRSGDIFNPDRIRDLVKLMKENDLREIDLKQGDQHLRLCRSIEEPAPRVVHAAPQPAHYAQTSSPPGVASAPAAPAAPAAEGKHIAVIKSPMVGTFYSRPKPDAPPFVSVGGRVSPETTVCIVEAMKTFNEIPAEISGTIVAVLVEDGDSVDHNRPLFKVDTSK
jgi:acetyl-CoA carboxylase biotin carboxyl carrier protein